MIRSERSLREQILARLIELGINARINTINVRHNNPGFGVGSPDILCVLPPIAVLVGLELKMPGEVQRDTQVLWQRQHEELGGLYYVVRTVREAEKALHRANSEMWTRIDKASAVDRRSRIMGRKQFSGGHRFRARLTELDSPIQTAGCRHLNDRMCSKRDLSGCAFANGDGICRTPPTNWPAQFERLVKLGGCR